MMDKRWMDRLARCWRSFERAAEALASDDFDARALLREVTDEQVESIVLYPRVDRDTHARNILLRMREALRVDGNN